MKINDFVVRFANVNGTGSASANALFTKAVFRMGVPVTPKNIFPSNIQGLPTWYEIRVSSEGYVSRPAHMDLVVALNPETYAKWSPSYFVKDFKTPTLVMHVRDDLRIPVALGREMAAGIPNARFVALPGKNHVMLEQDPGVALFSKELKSFVSESTG